MIPIWTEEPEEVRQMKISGIYALEKCVFCTELTNTWHENTNNPVCKKCASVRKVSEIPEDHGQSIRKRKRNGIFNRLNSVRAN